MNNKLLGQIRLTGKGQVSVLSGYFRILLLYNLYNNLRWNLSFKSKNSAAYYNVALFTSRTVFVVYCIAMLVYKFSKSSKLFKKLKVGYCKRGRDQGMIQE